MLLTETNQSPSLHSLQVCQSRLIDTPAATLQTNTPVAPPLQSAPALLGLHAHRRSLPDGVHTSARVPSLRFQYTRSWADTHTHTMDLAEVSELFQNRTTGLVEPWGSSGARLPWSRWLRLVSQLHSEADSTFFHNLFIENFKKQARKQLKSTDMGTCETIQSWLVVHMEQV